MKRRSLNDIEVAYHVYGDAGGGTPLILMHGFPDDASAWNAVGERPDAVADAMLEFLTAAKR